MFTQSFAHLFEPGIKPAEQVCNPIECNHLAFLDDGLQIARNLFVLRLQTFDFFHHVAPVIRSILILLR